MHSEDQAEFEALITEEMPELGAMWFKFYEREPDNYDDAGGFIVRFTLSDQRELERDERKKLDGLVRDEYRRDCWHSHDCCGCVFLSYVLIHESRGDVYVEVDFGRNY